MHDLGRNRDTKKSSVAKDANFKFVFYDGQRTSIIEKANDNAVHNDVSCKNESTIDGSENMT